MVIPGFIRLSGALLTVIPWVYKALGSLFTVIPCYSRVYKALGNLSATRFTVGLVGGDPLRGGSREPP